MKSSFLYFLCTHIAILFLMLLAAFACVATVYGEEIRVIAGVGR